MYNCVEWYRVWGHFLNSLIQQPRLLFIKDQHIVEPYDWFQLMLWDIITTQNKLAIALLLTL